MMAPLLPDILGALGLPLGGTERHLSFLTAAYAMGVVTAAPVFGSASDRIDRRYVMFVAVGLYAGSLYGIVAQPGLGVLYLLRLTSGLCMGTFLPVAMAYVSEHGAGFCRTQRFGWLTTATMVGALTGPYIGGLQLWTTLRTPADGRLTPVLAGAVLISFLLPLMAAALPSPARVTRRKRCATTSQPAPSPLYILFGLSAIVMYAVSTFEIGLSTLARLHLRLDTRTLGMMYAECALVMLAMQVSFFLRRVRNFANRHLLGPAGLATAAMVALFPSAATHAQLMWVTAVIAAGAGMITPLISYRISRSVYPRPGRKFGLQSAASHFGLALGAASGGWLAPLHPHLPYWVAAAVLALASAVAWQHLRRGDRGRRESARPAMEGMDGRPGAAVRARDFKTDAVRRKADAARE